MLCNKLEFPSSVDTSQVSSAPLFHILLASCTQISVPSQLRVEY